MPFPPDKHPAPERPSSDGVRRDVPPPSPHFRRRAWLEFQRALDPLAPPKPLPATRSEPPPH